jgi:hypothetical protein
MADSLIYKPYFFVDVPDTVSQHTVTAKGNAWRGYSLEVTGGNLDSAGRVWIDWPQAYLQGGFVGLSLLGPNNEILDEKQVKIPKPERIRINYLQPPGGVGERFPLELVCQFADGQVGRTPQLPWSLFTLTCRGDTLDTSYFFIPMYADSPEVLWLEATMMGDTSLYHALAVPCNYQDTIHIDLKGAAGLHGKHGNNGKPGQEWDRHGKNGHDGGDGADGLDVNLVLMPLVSGNDTVFKAVCMASEFVHTVFLRPGQGLLRVTVSGGPGGNGGNGGAGAPGNPDAHQQAGAAGGDGGMGGYGGNGGYGGKVKIITNTVGKDYLTMIEIDRAGAKGGSGGLGGAPGIHHVRKNAGFLEKWLKGKAVRTGKPGSDGYDGLDGPTPELWLVDDAELLRILLDLEQG